MSIVHAIFYEYKLAAALALNFEKTVFVPLSSGCPHEAAAIIRSGLDDSPWIDVAVDTSAALIGIPVGPHWWR